jgi:hypothetical protein
MKLLKNTKFLSLLNSYLIDSPLPVNISYLCNFGFLLGICLVIQIITGMEFTLISSNLNTVLQTEEFTYILNSIFLGLTQDIKKVRSFFCGYLKRFIYWLKTFDTVKGILAGLYCRTLPKSLENYHNNERARILRVIGGLCAIIVIFKADEMLKGTEFSFLIPVITVLSLCQFLYIFIIFFTRFLYTMYYIFTGKWIQRSDGSAPLK